LIGPGEHLVADKAEIRLQVPADLFIKGGFDVPDGKEEEDGIGDEDGQQDGQKQFCAYGKAKVH